MTKADIDSLPFETVREYFEHDYPYVFPENEAVDLLPLDSNLTKLEIVYIRWMIEVSNREMAIDRFIHPAFYYDKAKFGSEYLKTKELANNVLRDIRRNCPYLKLYTADYVTGLLHDEVQYLRSFNRKERLYGPSIHPSLLIGKKSRHDQEMEEIDRLLACLTQIQNLKVIAGGGFAGGSPNNQSGDLDHSIDRVITRSKELINSGETGQNRRT